MKSRNSLLYILIGISLIGLILSFLLTREYFGNAGELVSSLCSAVGPEGSCDKVKESDYSAFKVPGLGEIPIALFGFAFYGFVGSLAFFGLKQEESKEHVAVIFGVSLLALVVDAILLGISVFAIGAVCSLCAFTYIATIGLVIGSYQFIQRNFPEKGSMEQMKENLFPAIKKNLLTYLITGMAFFACGLGGGKMGTKTPPAKLGSSKDMIQASIEAYDKAPVNNISLQGVPFAGEEKSPIIIVKYADYNCGHCMHTSHALSAILAEYSGLVKVYYKNFPLDGHCNRLMGRKSPDASSCIAASAGLCAHKQNKFFPFYKSLYDDTELGVRHSGASVLSIAKATGLNIPAFQACMSGQEIPAFIAREVNEGEILNIQSTPSVYVNGKALAPGSPDPQFLRELIKHISAKL
jgi:protein-disulfide isomerase/uncharacterized membrane protein